ncbi:MAG TPA: YhjD/YihY/BrkB family envelope integrity protein [Candidatus Kryptonia bacterium]|nr:YhjD/YihY/BrkB family envelope integrity protein [Candidatus Kryptonia bacterium]
MTTADRPAPVPTRLRRFIGAVVARFYADQCLLHASALTYTSLLSLVPLLALMFAVLKGLGVQRRLEPLLLSQLSLSPEVTASVLTYIDRTNVGTLGTLGAVALVGTVLSVLGSIERSFNYIWRVRHGRTWWRKATDYVSTVLLTPFLLLAAVALTSSAQEQGLMRWLLNAEYLGSVVVRLLGMAPIVMNTIALGILYAVMPNRRPYVPGVILGAMVAGVVWQLVQREYVAMQIGVARYNAIYGALAQLPVTLVWIYVSWAVVLGGAELAAVYEFGADETAAGTSTTSRWAIALHLLLRAADAFRHGDGAIQPGHIARELHLAPSLVVDSAEQLRDAGILAAIDGTHDTYVLARDPATIPLGALTHAIDDVNVPLGCDPRVRSMLDTAKAASHASLQDVTLAALLDRPRS